MAKVNKCKLEDLLVEASTPFILGSFRDRRFSTYQLELLVICLYAVTEQHIYTVIQVNVYTCVRIYTYTMTRV